VKKAGLIAGVVFALAICATPASAKPGDLLVAKYGFAAVVRISPDGSNSSTLSNDDDFEALSYLTFGPDGSVFVTANVDTGSVFQIPRAGGNATDVGQFANDIFPWGIDRAPDGRLLVSDADNTVWQLQPGGTPTPFANSLTQPWGLDALPDETTLVADNTGRIVRLAANGDGSVFAEDPDLDQAADVQRAPNGDVYVVTQQADGHLVRIHDGAVEDLASSLGDVYSLALAPSGAVYTTDYSGSAINRVDPQSGDVTEIASAADGVGDPIGIEVEPPKCKGKTATIVGSNKRDRLKGSKFKDVIASLKGKDQLKGGKARDFLCAGKSKDKVKAAERKPKRDKVNCGTGNDKAIVDVKDKVARNCEEVVVR
jgi:hypothetical protein